MTRVMCFQLAPIVGDLARNQFLCSTAVERGIAAGAELIVLPELATSGYVFCSTDEAAACAIAAEDPMFGSWARLAAATNTTIVAGF